MEVLKEGGEYTMEECRRNVGGEVLKEEEENTEYEVSSMDKSTMKMEIEDEKMKIEVNEIIMSNETALKTETYVDKTNIRTQVGTEEQRENGISKESSEKTVLKEYKCTMCDYKTKWSGDLNRHKSTKQRA